MQRWALVPRGIRYRMKLRAAARSHVGRRRTANEDAYALAPELGLFLVADGMGGHVAGQVASRLAARSLIGALEQFGGGTLAPAEALRRSVVEANREVFATAESKPELAGMGTTLVALLAGAGRMTLAHVGDSRAYLVRGGLSCQLTGDHTLVAELVRRRELSASLAREHPQRHVLTRALGVRRQVDPDLAELTPLARDVVVLCSDGLTQQVSDQEIADLASSDEALHQVCERLVDLANERGGEDNVTVALIRCEADVESER